MTLGYDPGKYSWMTWADEGGKYFGGKDVTKALNMGVSHADIQQAIQDSDSAAAAAAAQGETGYGGRANISSGLQAAYDSARGGVLDSSLGASDYTGGADIALYTQARGGMTGQVAQEIRDQANYNPNLQIGGSMSNLAMGIGSYAAGQDAADTAAADAAAAQQWRSDEAEKSRQRYENMMAQQRDDAARAREQARIEGMKVKHRGSTSTYL